MQHCALCPVPCALCLTVSCDGYRDGYGYRANTSFRLHCQSTAYLGSHSLQYSTVLPILPTIIPPLFYPPVILPSPPHDSCPLPISIPITLGFNLRMHAI